jgi:hypothetical protein
MLTNTTLDKKIDFSEMEIAPEFPPGFPKHPRITSITQCKVRIYWMRAKLINRERRNNGTGWMYLRSCWCVGRGKKVRVFSDDIYYE